MDESGLGKVHSYWNEESCGESYAEGNIDREGYLAETKTRYELEPYILDFAEFDGYEGLDVLEIGVGMGSDHSQIAYSSPKSLTGVDLTERAIQHTKRRFSLLELKSELKTDNAEALSFKDSSFDAIYSWGVLHHSANTIQCFKEVQRVLRPNGVAKIMIYHKHAPTGWMLWMKYALLKGNPFISLNEIYYQYLESPGTKAYTLAEVRALTDMFSEAAIKVQLCHGDLLEGNVGERHTGPILKTLKLLYPRSLIRVLSKIFPIGLFLLITIKK
jgi:ubiquinone/menaquinone biosynthesis C-methylase UbiE